MATKPQYERDAEKVASGNLISLSTSLRSLYKDKPRKEAPAAEPAPKKRKLMGEDSLDEETRKEL